MQEIIDRLRYKTVQCFLEILEIIRLNKFTYLEVDKKLFDLLYVQEGLLGTYISINTWIINMQVTMLEHRT